MSKIDEIQRKLRELGDGAFQKLADAYLHERGYERINSVGSVSGAETVRPGTPDTYIPTRGGKYILAEYTTQRKGLFQKLMSDLRKCLNAEQTGIPIEKIEAVIFCHVGNLKPGEEDALRAECRKHHINLTVFGIGSLSYDLWSKFPRIARDFLGIEPDTGQIVSIDDFVALYGKSALATPLSTTFRFREDNLKKILEALENNEITIVTGRPGVGKSRLALESCRQFLTQHPEFNCRCIFNRGIPQLYQDLLTHFSDDGDYLIFVDDANRLGGLDYILDLLHKQTEKKHFRILTTVRDYALRKIQQRVEPFGGATEIGVEPFKDEQIREFVKGEFNITHHLALERIADIARGNPRLAVMAAEVIKKEKMLGSINDVSLLYDRYYASIRTDLESLGDRELVRAAGIISFFRSVDFSNNDLLSTITLAWGISRQDFLEAAKKLHDLEVVDLYENEVAKFSDQVLSTYLFYLAFFKLQELSLASLLDYFFPKFSEKIVDAVSPVLSAFDFDEVKRILRKSIDDRWEALRYAKDEHGLHELIQVFWWVNETDSLLYIGERIAALPAEPAPLIQASLKPEPNIPAASVLSLLRLFRHASEESTFRIALHLTLEYANKRPKDVNQILFVLETSFGFTHASYLQNYVVQQWVMDALWQRTEEGQNALMTSLFFEVSTVYLHTQFHETEFKGGRSFVLIDFALTSTPPLIALRKSIWEKVQLLFSQAPHREEVLRLLEDYVTSGNEVLNKEILLADVEILLPLVTALDPNNYRHCVLVIAYLDKLDAAEISYAASLRRQFTHESVTVLNLISDDWTDMKKRKLSFEQYKTLKQERIKAFFAKYSFEDYQRFLTQVLEIYTASRDGPIQYKIQEGVGEVLLSVAEGNPQLFVSLMNEFLAKCLRLRVHPYRLVEQLVKIEGEDRVLEKMQTLSSHGHEWLFAYFESLSEYQIKEEHLPIILSLFESLSLNERPRWDWLLKYRTFDSGIVVRAAEIMVAKADSEMEFGHAFDLLFNQFAEVNKRIGELFANAVSTLKRAYFAYLSVDQHGDFEGRTMQVLLDLDAAFLQEYVDWMYTRKVHLSHHDDNRNYAFLWLRPDYFKIITALIQRVYQQEEVHGSYFGSFLQAFFILHKDAKEQDLIRERQGALLKDVLKTRCAEYDYIKFVFEVITQLPTDRQREFISLFLEHDKDIEHFRMLPLEPRSWSAMGSWVPVLQSRIIFLESLLPLANTAELLLHKQLLEQRIDGLRKWMEEEAKRDFIGDY